MARIRTIKPKHVEDKGLATISMQAHLLWILSWCYSDDEGIFENDPLLIKSQLFPRRTDVRVEQISQWLDQLEMARFIIPFTYNGDSYYIHRTFKTHQKIDKPQASKIPESEIRRVFAECSENGRYSKGEESNVKEGIISPSGEDIVSMYKSLEKNKKSIWDFIKNKGPDFIEPYMDIWNVFAAENKMAEVKTLNTKRKNKFKVRIKEKPFDFLGILKKAGQSEFLLRGKWFGFDWIIENDTNYLKILEGNFDKKEKSNYNEKNRTGSGVRISGIENYSESL